MIAKTGCAMKAIGHFIVRLIPFLMICLFFSIAGCGNTTRISQTDSGQAPDPDKPEANSVQTETVQAGPVETLPRQAVDLYGDPLPTGAVARLGTTRLRHQGQVTRIEFSADGKSLASAGSDRAVVVWDVSTGKTRHRLVGHLNTVSTIALSRDGKLIASGSRMNGQVIIWDAINGAKKRELPRSSVVHAVAFSPDANNLATVSHRGIHIWNVDMGIERRSFQEKNAFWVEFAPDGQTVVSASGRDTSWIRLWDLRTGKELRSFEWTKIRSAALSPDGKMLAAGRRDGTIRVWNTESGEIALEFPSAGSAANWNADMCFGPNGDLLASVGDSRTSRAIRIFSLKTARKVTECPGDFDGSPTIAFSPDGNMVASGGWRGTIRFWNARSGDEIVKTRSHFSSVRSVVFVAGEDFVVTKSTDNTIRLWNAATAAQKDVVRAYYRSAISPDGQILVSPGNNNTVRVFDLQAGQHLHTFTGHSALVEYLAFTADGITLASLDKNGLLFVWRATSGDLISMIDASADIRAITFSPDGKTLAAGRAAKKPSQPQEEIPAGEDFDIYLWDAATGKELAKLGSAADPVSDLAFSPDGKSLASAHGLLEETQPAPTSVDAGYTVRLWDIKSGDELASLKGHTATVSSVAFNKSGTILASGSMDGTVCLWDVANAKEIATLRGHGLPVLNGADYYQVYSVAFSPDDRLVASAAKDGTVVLWDVNTVTKTAGSP
ncbi:MAG: WD40 repeat domain-containing protein [Planctomycetota bacterium]|jgi:WD40 repeat protein